MRKQVNATLRASSGALLLTGIVLATPGIASEPAATAPAAVTASVPATAAPSASATPAQHAHGAGDFIFAEVDGQFINGSEYEATFITMARQKFYHGKPPEAQVQALRVEVADRLVNRVLMLKEVKRREIPVDEAAIQATLAEYEKRYGNTPGWKQNRDAMLPGLSAKLREQQQLDRLEANVRAVPAATTEEVRAYYDSHPELFTEPEKLHLSVILLKVDPSSPSSAWDKAEEEAAAIERRIKAGADFGELARLHSGDGSAENNGDMGYLHRGMLPDALHDKLDKFQPGQVSGPLRVLEGVSLFRLENRRLPNKRAFEEVAPRATELLQRERSDQAWKDFIAKLRVGVNIRINTDNFPFLKPAAAEVK